jgi:hypothetical protein
MEVIGNLRYANDTLSVNLAIQDEKITEMDENYEILANDYREATNEEHHLKIINSPDTLSREFLFQVAERYRGQLGYPTPMD